jgi:hypothetical protein
LSIITTRKEHGWIGKFLKIDSTSVLFKKYGLPWKREDYNRKWCCCQTVPLLIQERAY